MTPWPHQLRAVDLTRAAIARGVRRLALTSPTGGGKSLVICLLIEMWLAEGLRVALYTNRRLLVEQLNRTLEARGIEHGVRAAGWEDCSHRDVQICSLQTEGTRTRRAAERGNVWQLHDANRVIVDEGHLHTGPTARTILNAHHEAGAAYLLVTATPLGLAGQCDELILAGTTSELRACGALVPAMHYGPDEPDLRHIGQVVLGEDLGENQVRKAMGKVDGGKADRKIHQLFGRVLDWWKKLNPEQKPTILFAPGVGESIWFAEQFAEAGVPAAHIDGEHVWIEGRLEPTSPGIRDELLGNCERPGAIRTGEIKVLCNRFVCREGVDIPEIEHVIDATVFGSLQSYLQSNGRGLRACPATGKTKVIIQDHGGNWHRHGSLNSDREWRLEYTAGMVAAMRADRLRQKQEREPIRCPKCGMILGCTRCPCGFEVEGRKKSRPVIQQDGTLKELHGDIYRPRRITQQPNAAQIWERMYYRSKKARRTFKQAEALFAMENNWGWPPHTLPLMPKEPLDWYQVVGDVPAERLT